MNQFERKQITRALRAFASSIQNGNEYGAKMGWTPEHLRKLAKEHDAELDTLRLCEKCGEPMVHHVGGVRRGLCMNKVN